MPLKKKKQTLISKLSNVLQSPKGRLVATMVIFAVIGGGIYVYQSFAAVPGTTQFRPSDGTLTASVVGSTAIKTVDGSFSASQVWQLRQNGQARIDNQALNPSLKGSYRVCAILRALSGDTNVDLRFSTAAGGTQTKTFRVGTSGNEICTASALSGNYSFSAAVVNNNSTWVSVVSMNLTYNISRADAPNAGYYGNTSLYNFGAMTKTTDSQMPGINVWQMHKNDQAQTAKAVVSKNSGVSAFQYCAVVRALTSNTSVKLGVTANSKSSETSYNVGTSWTTICSGFVPMLGTEVVSGFVRNNNDTWVNLAYMYQLVR